MTASLVIFLFLFWTAVSAGNQCLRFFRFQFKESLEELLFSYGTGLFFLSYLVLGLGVFGFLEKKWLWLGVFLLASLGFSRSPHILKLFTFKKKSGKEDGVPLWLWVCLGLPVLLIGLGALVPPFGTDALVYHLSGPAHFLRLKRVGWIPDDVNSLFPFFSEMLFTMALALRDEIVAQLFHWSLGVMAALSIAAFFHRFFGSRKWGVVAAIFFLLTPGVFNEMRTALVDVAWTAYGFLSFYALVVGILEKKRDWLCLSFVFLGVTLGIKYLAALSAAVFFCSLIFLAFQSGWRTRQVFQWVLVMLSIVTAVSGYWYFKAYSVYRNPFYPYFNSLFGLEPLKVGLQLAGDYSQKVGMGNSLVSFLLFPVNITLFPTRFDGWAEQLGCAYLLFLPFAFRGPQSKARSAVILYAALFTAGWFWLAQVTRFLYPALPFFILLIMNGLSYFYKNQKKNTIFCSALLVLVFLLHGALLIFHSRESFAYWTGREDRESFLLRHERSYRMAKFVNENLPLDAKILNDEEVRAYYFKRNWVRGGLYRLRTRYDQVPDLGEALNRLKQDGFTHLLLADVTSGQSTEGIRKWVGPGFKEKRLEELYHTDFKERDGRRVEYVLYRLL